MGGFSFQMEQINIISSHSNSLKYKCVKFLKYLKFPFTSAICAEKQDCLGITENWSERSACASAKKLPLNLALLVRAECMRQCNKVAIKLVIISLSLFSLSWLSALSRLGLWLADDFKGKPPHWLLGVNSYWSELNVSTSVMSYGNGRQT